MSSKEEIEESIDYYTEQIKKIELVNCQLEGEKQRLQRRINLNVSEIKRIQTKIHKLTFNE